MSEKITTEQLLKKMRENAMTEENVLNVCVEELAEISQKYNVKIDIEYRGDSWEIWVNPND